MSAEEAGAAGTATTGRRLWRLAPLLVSAVVGAVFAVQLYRGNDGTLRSALIERPSPEFSLPLLGQAEGALSTADLKTGEVTVLNLWASWCGPCRIEHPELIKLSERDDVTLYGVAYRDKTEASQRFLAQLGDPFAKVGEDADGQASLRWGVSGVPETFVIAGDGTVIYKHVGPIQNSDLEKKILPAIEAARAR